MIGQLTVSRSDVLAAAIVFGGFKRTFTARDFTSFLQTQAHGAEEEQVDELLCDFSDAGLLRRIGPGVYAKLSGAP